MFLSALLSTLFTTMVLAQIPSNCSSNFEQWMPGVPPNSSPCKTWSYSSTGTTWSPVQKNGKWTWYMPDATTTTSSYLQIGNVAQPLSVNNNSIAFLEFDTSNLEFKRDGITPEYSPDVGATWIELITPATGAILSPPDTTLMTGGPLLGKKGFTGVFSGKYQIDFRTSTLVGSTILLRLRFGSDNSIGRTGVWVTSFDYWYGPITPPQSVVGQADNTCLSVQWTQRYDPRNRLDLTELWDNGSSLGVRTSPVQICNLANGSTHAFEVKNYDTGKVHVATTACNPSPLIPTCTGKPPMTLITGSKSPTYVQWSFIAQSAQVPCVTGIPGPVDGYTIWRSNTPSVQGTIIGSGGPTTLSFFDTPGLSDGITHFYTVLSTKNGVSE